jgi:serine/threonine protein kinase
LMAADDANLVGERLDHLLSLWEAHAAQGRDVPAAELCPDSLTLAVELDRRIRVIRAVNAMAGTHPSDATVPEEVQIPGLVVAGITFGGEVDASLRARATEAPLPEVTGYEVLSELGHGGMGVVYLARQTSLNRNVALKMIAGVDSERRFLQEAELVARLRHPNIVQVYDYGTTAGRAYFAQEYLESGSLADRWGAEPQPPREAAELAQVLAWAVHAAHEKGVVHRDLKPQNILLAADGTPKVTDFGLAKGADSALTVSGAVLGTPSYMAPEQASGDSRKVGPVADVYALGTILYQALTGRPPFRGTTAWETVQQVMGTDPVPPARIQPGVPRDLETVCLK